MRRAAIYARYSTNLQNPASIADQVAACRELAARLGVEVVAVFSDAAISGQAVGNRPGYLEMMAAAARGEFELVLAEALDRVSRGQADTAITFEDLLSLDVRIHTIAEGLVDELHVGLKGTMNALYIRDIGAKARRGLKGVLDSGRAIITPYGYDVVRKIGETGEVIVGLRKINPEKAAVVRRVFEDYVAGLTPKQIVVNLNAEGVPSPRGGAWPVTSIIGQSGMLRREIYRGILVWGKTAARKDRRTGRRRLVTAAPDMVVRVEREDLRIISDDLWDKTVARMATRRAPTHLGAHALRHPKGLLSGIVTCGTCDKPMVQCKGEVVDGVFQGRFQCGNRLTKGPSVCSNKRTPRAREVEERVVAAVRERLLRPEAVEAAVREVHRLMAERSKTAGADRGRLERELAETRRKAERLVDLVADGAMTGVAVRDKLQAFETRAAAIERELASLADNANVVAIHPAAGDHYRRLVQDLVTQLDRVGDTKHDAGRVAARDAFRNLIGQVRLIPGEKKGEYELEIIGELQRVLAFITGRSLDAASAEGMGQYRISG